jgi:hypothetical protein
VIVIGKENIVAKMDREILSRPAGIVKFVLTLAEYQELVETQHTLVKTYKGVLVEFEDCACSKLSKRLSS